MPNQERTRFLHGDLSDPQRREFYCGICDIFAPEAHLESAHPREQSVDRFLNQLERYGTSGRENWFDNREDIAVHKLRKAGGSFFRWLAQQVDRQDAIGDLAEDAIADKSFPGQASRLEEVLVYLSNRNAAEDAILAARAAWSEFNGQNL